MWFAQLKIHNFLTVFCWVRIVKEIFFYTLTRRLKNKATVIKIQKLRKKSRKSAFLQVNIVIYLPIYLPIYPQYTKWGSCFVFFISKITFIRYSWCSIGVLDSNTHFFLWGKSIIVKCKLNLLIVYIYLKKLRSIKKYQY